MNNIFSKSFDIPDLSMSFKDDPKYIHLDDTIRVITFCVIKHLNICTKLTASQNYDKSMIDLIASNIYNNLCISHPFTTNTTSSDEIMDSDFATICTIFKNSMDKNGSMGIYSKQIQDPRLCMFNFTHFLFIPVRADIQTLSDDLKINSLRKWLTVIMTLPFTEQYIQRYINAITNMDAMVGIACKITTSEDIRTKLMNMDNDFIFKAISTRYTTSNTSHIFIRLLANLITLISIEVLKKWCPNIRECMSANPDYDGAWLNPFDTVVNDQVLYIQKITQQLTETIKT